MSNSNSETPVVQSKTGLFSKVALVLTGQMAITAAGSFIGQHINDNATFIALFIAAIAGIFAVRWAAAKSKAIGLGVAAVWTFIMGLVLAPLMAFYMKDLGAAVVVQSFLGTGAVMAICGAVTAFSSIDFSNRAFGRVLLLGLLGMIAAGLVNIFVSFGHAGTIGYSIVGMLLFTGYFLFDFHRLIKKSDKSDDTWEYAIWTSVGLYLDYINFLEYLLRLRSELQK